MLFLGQDLVVSLVHNRLWILKKKGGKCPKHTPESTLVCSNKVVNFRHCLYIATVYTQLE